MASATFRFYEELNEFLAPSQRRRDVERPFAASETVKHAIEALGVPHTEVELVLRNGESVGFEARLADRDRIAVYPKFETFDVTPLLRVRERPLRELRFIADAHLGALAKLLRLSGFDTLYENALHDGEIERIAAAEGRVVLTRDRELLKRRSITHGAYVHAQRPAQQWRELFERLDLARSARPFTLCLECNAPLRRRRKADVLDALPEAVRARHDRIAGCDICGRLFWEGSHWRRMRDRVDALLAGAADPGPTS
jgi:uncharacterized protein with PIN domain